MFRNVKFSLICVIGAVLTTPIRAQGTIEFNNLIPGVVNSPVFDIDFLTPLWPPWQAQLFGAPATPNWQDGPLPSLVSLLPFTTFRTRPTGYVEPVIVTFPGLEPIKQKKS